MTTHYIPSFCRRRTNGEQMAVCGVWLKPWLVAGAHSPEPSCQACQAWIAEDADIRAREDDQPVVCSICRLPGHHEHAAE